MDNWVYSWVSVFFSQNDDGSILRIFQWIARINVQMMPFHTTQNVKFLSKIPLKSFSVYCSSHKRVFFLNKVPIVFRWYELTNSLTILMKWMHWLHSLEMNWMNKKMSSIWKLKTEAIVWLKKSTFHCELFKKNWKNIHKTVTKSNGTKQSMQKLGLSWTSRSRRFCIVVIKLIISVFVYKMSSRT